MKSLQESLFDTDLVSKETGYEYLYGLVKYIDYISSPQWVFPDWIKNYVERVEKNMINTFRLDTIRNDYKKIIGKFDLQDWTEYPADPKRGYSYTVVQKDPYKDLIRQLIYIIVCTIETSKVMDFNTGWIDNNKLKREINGILKKYTRIHSTAEVFSDVRDDIRMYQISYDVDFPEVHSNLFEGDYCFFKIAFKNLNGTNESLFDTDLVTKDIKFGDMYKPVWITSTNSDNPFKKITNMFNMGELRKAAKDKKLDLSGVQQNSHYDNKYLDTIEMIAGLVADFPYKPKPYYAYYNSDIINTFKPLVRSHLFRRGIDVGIQYRGLVRGLGNDIIELHITKSTATEYTDVVIKFDKK